MNTLIAGAETHKIPFEVLTTIDAPEATATHLPIRHADIVSQAATALAMRHINVINQEFAVSPDGMRMFGLMVTDREFDGCNYSIGLRNSNDKSMKLGMVAGYRVMVCENMAFAGDFHPLLAKHTSNFSLEDSMAIAIDRIHRAMENVSEQVRFMRAKQVNDQIAEKVVYDAFVPKSGIRLPKQIMDAVHDNWYTPAHPEFEDRTAWSLHNAFTSAFKGLKPIRQFQATGQLTPFLIKEVGLN